MKVINGHNIGQTGNQNEASIVSNHEMKPRWYQKPIGIILVTVVAGLIVAALAKHFGWV